MSELLRIWRSGLSLLEGESLALMGGEARTIALTLAGRMPLARHFASQGIMDLARIPPDERRYAYLGGWDELAAKKTVGQNFAAAGRPTRAVVAAALELVGLIGADEQPVGPLSRFDRQRVALARALVTSPRLLILDDPTANLPPLAQAAFRRLLLKLRAARPHIAMLVVSERREDALMLADRVAVLEGAELLQQGTPRELYENPASDLVALALGDCNLLPGDVIAVDDDVARVRLDGGAGEVEAMAPPGAGAGMRGLVAVRPERVAVAPFAASLMEEGAIEAMFADIIFLGDTLLLRFTLKDGSSITAKRPSAAPLRGLLPGRKAALAWTAGAARLLVAGLR